MSINITDDALEMGDKHGPTMDFVFQMLDYSLSNSGSIMGSGTCKKNIILFNFRVRRGFLNQEILRENTRLVLFLESGVKIC